MSWSYSRPQLEHARQRVAEIAPTLNEWPPPSPSVVGRGVNQIVTEFGLLALAYEELLSQWEAQKSDRSPE